MGHGCDSISKTSLCKTFPISKVLGVTERVKSLNQFYILNAMQMLGIAMEKVRAQTLVTCFSIAEISLFSQEKKCDFE